MKASNLIGQVFEKLTVTKITKERKNNKIVWECACSCGNITTATTGQLNSGRKKSCGCLIAELQKNKRTTYKYRSIGVYGLWSRMISRCYGKTNIRSHKWYKDKGIKVCDQWKDPVVFCEWALSEGYKKGHTIHRKDSDIDYNPKNCIIITKKKHYKLHSKINTTTTSKNTLKSTNTTGYPGVSYNKKHKFYTAYIYNGIRIHLGCFNSAKSANNARLKYIKENKL